MTPRDSHERAIGLLPGLGFIRVGGEDAGRFLQSMLSADIAALEREQNVLTGWHDRNGRALAVLRVVHKSNGFWLVLPRELVAATIDGLGRFVLRSQVTLDDASQELAAAAVAGDAGDYEVYAAAAALSARVDSHHEQGTARIGSDEWELTGIRAGRPAVYAATRGMFTAQMLNLDLIGGVSFTKGCYPGQEIIARTHHLGRAKRRMLRFVAEAPPPAAGGELLTAEGKRGGHVVRAAPAGSGSEALVVAPVDGPGRLHDAAGRVFEVAALPYSTG